MQRNALPASVAAAFGSEASPTWLPLGPSGNLRALNKLHSLPPSTHRMCFLLTRQPTARHVDACSPRWRVSEVRRGFAQSLECIAHSNVRCISSEAAPNRSALAGNYYYYYLHLKANNNNFLPTYVAFNNICRNISILLLLSGFYFYLITN